MITYREFLTEGRDAPLYHGTSLTNAENILSTNRLEARSFDRHPGKIIKQKIVSLTRDFRYARDWLNAQVVFELDQAKLAQRYEMTPKNYWGVTWKHKFTDYGKKARPSVTKGNFNTTVRPEFEEAIIGTIVDVRKYITKIILTDGGVERKLHPGVFPELAASPLLYSFENRKFINA